ncbi:MAG: 23S rRNA (guanosine(2251)-2'-O)-methyltransferase RlmB [Zetaproteobacteria bacterium]|nr:MAG: 23S rRNA (guanosine(2251)-2'-O)-methyltransferase RlmB [Zetaproteobacteria bacterium]
MKGSRDRGDAPQPEFVAGPHAALEVLRAGKREVRRLTLARQEGGAAIEAIVDLARERKVPVETRQREDLDRQLRGATHQGVLLEVGPFPYAEPDAVVTRASTGPEPGFLLVLDGVQDPQNLGAIVRSAEAAGVHGCILPRDRAVGVSPAAVRASAGATEHLLVARVTNVATFLEAIKSQGFWVVGSDAAGDRDLFGADLSVPLALVVGGEGRGLRQLTKARCDLIVRIPSRGKIGSLNASAAAAVCLFEAARQRAVRRGRDPLRYADDRASGSRTPPAAARRATNRIPPEAVAMDAIMLTGRDTVATALRDLAGGEVAAVGVLDETRRVAIREPIPFGHKFAVIPVRTGDLVLKYGEVIGRATRDIPLGAHAHVHNIESLRGRGDLATTGA